MNRRAPILAAIALGYFAAWTARGSILFWDDAESGQTLIANGGRWTYEDLYVTDGSVTVTASPAAAHRGTYGLRFVDGDSSPGASGGVADLGATVSAPDADVYLRTWMRVTATVDAGEFGFIGADSTSPPVGLLQMDYIYPQAGASFRGQDDLGSTNDPTRFIPDRGGWHLVEIGFTGFGMDGGQRTLWVDGAEQALDLNQDFQGISFHDLGIGEVASGDWVWAGNLDYDDVRASTEPPASTLAVSVQASAPVGACVPVTVSLTSSAGTAAAAPYPFSAGLTTSAGQLYSDPNCSQAVASANFVADAGAAVSYFASASPGQVTLGAFYVDFLPSSPAQLTVVGVPVASISPSNASVDAGSQVMLDGSGSTAPSGSTIAAYQWTYPRGPTGLTLQAGASSQSLLLSVPGDYEFDLTVRDSSGRTSAPGSAHVHVQGELPPPPGLGCQCSPAGTLGFGLLAAWVGLWAVRRRRS